MDQTSPKLRNLVASPVASLFNARYCSGTEGIISTVELSGQELRDKIKAGEITDGFTLSSWALLNA